MRPDVLIRVVDAVSIDFGFAVAVSYSVNVLSGVAVDVLMDAFAGVLAAIRIGVLSAIGIGALMDVNVINVFTGVMLVEFAMSATSTGFGCWAAFDCRRTAVLNCDRVLQALMPSYHV